MGTISWITMKTCAHAHARAARGQPAQAIPSVRREALIWAGERGGAGGPCAHHHAAHHGEDDAKAHVVQVVPQDQPACGRAWAEGKAGARRA